MLEICAYFLCPFLFFMFYRRSPLSFPELFSKQKAHSVAENAMLEEGLGMKQAGERPKIEIGYRVGKLTVEAATEQRKNGYMIWRCRCSCGGEILMDTRSLQRGTVTDCGCVSKLKPGQKDITGRRFGKLVAVKPTKETLYGTVVWHCICDCGGEIDVPLHQLTAGYRKSCGCLSHPALKEFVGKRFGRLVVTAYAGKRDGMHRWKCLCDCGKETVVGQTLLQSGKTKSCGCLGHPEVKDLVGRRFGRLVVTAYAGKQGGVHRWRCRCDCGRETTVGHSLLLSGKTKSCGCLRAETYRENLKLIGGTSVTILEAGKNRLIASNTSGHTGVYQNKRSGKWAAQITFRGKTYYLGSYSEKEEAVKARRRGEELHDDFLAWYHENFPKPAAGQAEENGKTGDLI